MQPTRILSTSLKTCLTRSPLATQLRTHEAARFSSVWQRRMWSPASDHPTLARGFKTNVLQVRKGNVVEINNILSVVLKRESSVMGRGTSTIKLDVQDLLTGTKHTERFRSGDMVEVTDLEDHKCQFLYKNDGQLHLMDPESFEMYEVPESVMDDKQAQMLQPDMMVHLSIFQPDPDVPGKPISVKLPAQAIYIVKEAHASAAQANKGTVYKNADLENGIKVQVPDFVNIGDRVVVDTETGKYVKRA